MLYRLRKVSDLRPHPKNPREMTPAARELLIKYLAEFGDLSGVVLNARSGYLIAGHQRVAELTRAHGAKLKLADSALVTPAGDIFPIRVVDWPEPNARAAMLAANNRAAHVPAL